MKVGRTGRGGKGEGKGKKEEEEGRKGHGRLETDRRGVSVIPPLF